MSIAAILSLAQIWHRGNGCLTKKSKKVALRGLVNADFGV